MMLQDVVVIADMQDRNDDVIQSLCLLNISEVSGVVILNWEVRKEHMTFIVIFIWDEITVKSYVLNLVNLILIDKSHICILSDAIKKQRSVNELKITVMND